MKNIITLVLFSSLTLQTFAQSLETYFAEVRAGKFPTLPQEITKAENAKSVLGALSLYYKDTTSAVRSKAYSVTRTIASKSKQEGIHQLAVQNLINACRDRDSGNVGSVLGYLTEFKKEDFTAVAKDSLRNLFKSRIAHLDRLIKLIGFIEIADLQSDLRALAAQTDARKIDRWSAQLALGRMGDKQSMQSIMDRVKKMQVNDDVVYDIFADLIYTRQLDAVGYLTRVLYSDENNCQSPNSERVAKIPCAYRVMEQIAPILEGYPLKLDESGDIDTKDYPEALKTVRAWGKQQKEFKIIKNTY
jgi:hypothetical protein